MDNQRLLIWAFFALMAFWSYEAWMRDYGPQPPVVSQPATDEAAGPAAAPDALPDLADTRVDAPVMPAEDAAPEAAAPRGAVVRVTTDVFDIAISTHGGTLIEATLLEYPVAKDRPDDLVQLLSGEPGQLGMIQTGLRSAVEGAEPNHLATFTAERQSYSLGADDELLVPLRWTDAAGLSVEKRYRFTRGSYAITVEQTVRNGADSEWRGAPYAQIQRRSFPQERSMFDVDSYSFDGPIIYNGDKAEKLKRDDLLDDGPFSFAADNGWFGAIQHHFVSAVVPEQGDAQRYRVAVRDNVATASAIGSPLSIAPGDSATFSAAVFVGPKLQAQLQELSPTLKLTVDYGILTILSQPLFWLLSKAYELFANWGVAIIAVTILIKLVFYKLTESSGRSMAKMRNLQPRIKTLQERYKDDRQQLSQAMMDLYKREKVNPAAGCLPILVQMPFFLAFYWVLLESVEMRQAPFALWITDLSSRDPFFILPLIMGVAMFLQQKLNPQVGDPVQIKVMQIMPVLFTAMFAFFPAGLVLYWVTNTVLSIAQQWKINKVVEREAKQAKAGKKQKSSDD
jgi:YidC/Oxa1 family membrane protein insertase